MFITFEGPEGSGKTTQLPRLAAWLEQQGYPVLTTREPGGTAIGDQIRAILMDRAHTALVPEAEILLFSASRAQLVREVIRPALDAGTVVLCDRFFDSTLAYQGYGHGLDLATLRQITEFATGGLQPDLTILLDVESEQGLSRRQAGRASGAEWNRLDAQTLAFHRRVRAGYLMLAATDPRWQVVDASCEPDAVHLALRDVVMQALSRRRLVASDKRGGDG